MKKKKIIKIAAIVAALIILCAFLLYLLTGNYAASEEALRALASTERVTVSEQSDSIVFAPAQNETKTGFLFYPGGKVDARAYAPLAHALAEEGIYSVIVKMPFNLAIFGQDGAKSVMDTHPEISTWLIGGHSLGGVMAAEYATKDERISGIVFLAAYPNSDLSESGLRALSLTASNDGVLNREKYEEALSFFPADTVFYEIEGGNHAGFGSYGAQDGDGSAAISPDEQTEIAVREIMEWIGG